MQQRLTKQQISNAAYLHVKQVCHVLKIRTTGITNPSGAFTAAGREAFRARHHHYFLPVLTLLPGWTARALFQLVQQRPHLRLFVITDATTVGNPAHIRQA